MYIVIHSLDPYLLARMATDLQMEGIFLTYSNSYSNPFVKNKFNGKQYLFMAIYGLESFAFYSHDCSFNDKGTKGIYLTKSNYLQTLSFILENKDK